MAKVTKAQLLRRLLARGRWYSSADLVRAGIGYRYRLRQRAAA